MSDRRNTSSGAEWNQAHSEDLPLEELFNRYLPGLNAFVRRRAGALLRAKESHSDLVQSACREVLQNMDRFQFGGEVGFRQWLYRTAERKIADRWRFYHAEKRDADKEVHFSSSSSNRDSGGFPEGEVRTSRTPSRDAVVHETMRRIDDAFQRLPEDMQEVVFLGKFLGLPRKEIAVQMERSETAVRVLLHRSLARLSGLLAEDDQEPV